MSAPPLGNKRCVHVVATLDYAPDLCAMTLPRIQAYAKKIGADFNRITERRFPDYPINYERMQIYQLGKEYDWNFNIDADILLGSSLLDVTTRLRPENVGTAMLFKLSDAFPIAGNPVFENAKQDVGIVDMFNLTTKLTHELWRPLPGPFEQYRNCSPRWGERKVSEYCVSMNFHRNNYTVSGLFAPSDHIHHLNYTTLSSPSDIVTNAEELLASWGEGR